jgi:hypothetical protein
MTPQISGKTLLIPRVQYWRKHGWRAEVIIDEIGTLGDVVISEFVETREEAQLMAEEAMAKAAASERGMRRRRLGLR